MHSNSQQNEYSFLSGDIHLDFKTTVITGVNRSGKTTIGNLLSKNASVEHADEPWLLYTLPIMIKLGLINQQLGKDMFVTYVTELMNDRILLRNANFRPNDLSSIWKQKTHEQIFARMLHLQNREDVKNFINENSSLLLLTLSESAMFSLSIISDLLPQCKIIHVLRNGLHVAKEIEAKRWFSDEQIVKPINAQLYRAITWKGKTVYLPWWLCHADEQNFLQFSEYERGVLYWCTLIENAAPVLKELNKDNRCITVNYEKLCEDPAKILSNTASFLDICNSDSTASSFSSLDQYQNESNPFIIPRITEELRERAENLYENLKQQ